MSVTELALRRGTANLWPCFLHPDPKENIDLDPQKIGLHYTYNKAMYHGTREEERACFLKSREAVACRFDLRETC